jgi:hypothetical protein
MEPEIGYNYYMEQKQELHPVSIGIVTVATNIYIDYWISMVESFLITSNSSKVFFHVFTDQVDKARKFIAINHLVNCYVHPVKEMGWPEATLLRYEVFSQYQDQLNEFYLMHLDADMLFVEDPFEIFLNKVKQSKMVLVYHPGFWRGNLLNRVFTYINDVRILLSDIKLYVSVGNLGAWETNKRSAAFVSRKRRQGYFCGGVWFGENLEFKKMCSVLSLAVHEDIKKNLIARWHDESHLNKWATQNSHSSLPPSFCYDETYPNLNRIKPVIIAVRKMVKTRGSK